jgi:hypothetical protein
MHQRNLKVSVALTKLTITYIQYTNYEQLACNDDLLKAFCSELKKP